MYSEIIMDHFGHPRNIGKPESYNAKGVAGKETAGPFVVFFLRIEAGSILDVGYLTYGCAPAIAAGSFLTESIKGGTVEDAGKIDADSLREGLGGLPLSKRFCADLAVGALRCALRNYKQQVQS